MDDAPTSRDALIFAMPFLRAVGATRCEMAMALAVGCWNLALLPEEDQHREKARLLESFDFGASWMADVPIDVESLEKLKGWVERLIERKKNKFGHRQRVIVVHKISFDGEKMNLTTGTAPVPERTPPSEGTNKG